MSNTKEHKTFPKDVKSAEIETESDTDIKPSRETELEIKPKLEPKTKLETETETESKSRQTTKLHTYESDIASKETKRQKNTSHTEEQMTFSKDGITADIKTEPHTRFFSMQSKTNGATTKDDYISAHIPKAQIIPKAQNAILTNLDDPDFDVKTKTPETQNYKINSVKNLPTSTRMASQGNTETRENSPIHHDWSSSSSRYKGIYLTVRIHESMETVAASRNSLKNKKIIPKVRPVEETVSMTDVVSGENPKIYGDAPPPLDPLDN